MPADKKKIVHIHHGQQQFKTVMTVGSHELIADEPEPSGGADLGPDPYDLLLMALGSCSAITMRLYAKRKNWPLEDVYIELRHYKTHAKDCLECEEKDARLDKIEKEIIVKGNLNEEQNNKLLEISKKCPVQRTLLGQIQIESTLENR
ncbi:MAG: OsmC family protein [Balneolales bacterium]